MIAMIFGVTGQDGYYLSKLLLDKGYKVIGVHRRSSNDNTIKLHSLIDNTNLTLVEGDVTDPSSVQSLIKDYVPDEVYNLAAQSHVATSFHQPTLTWQVTAGGCFNILEAIRFVKPDTKFYQASSSEMFGSSFTQGVTPDLNGNFKFQNEKTPMVPQSPYAVAKLAAHHMVRLYRESYGLFACSGILFNHESPMRGEMFVTRKITKWIGEYKYWISAYREMGGPFPDGDYIYTSQFSSVRAPKLRLGNLDAFRDWGHAEDYVEAMWLMLQHDKPDDYVVSTMETNSIKDFLREAFEVAGLRDYNDYIVIDPQFFRPAEVDYLLGDSTKARQVLGWTPKHNFQSLVKEMVEYDIGQTERRR
jgi:GDPmannose 4,6-dehydratase